MHNHNYACIVRMDVCVCVNGCMLARQIYFRVHAAGVLSIAASIQARLAAIS